MAKLTYILLITFLTSSLYAFEVENELLKWKNSDYLFFNITPKTQTKKCQDIETALIQSPESAKHFMALIEQAVADTAVDINTNKIIKFDTNSTQEKIKNYLEKNKLTVTADYDIKTQLKRHLKIISDQILIDVTKTYCKIDLSEYKEIAKDPNMYPQSFYDLQDPPVNTEALENYAPASSEFNLLQFQGKTTFEQFQENQNNINEDSNEEQEGDR